MNTDLQRPQPSDNNQVPRTLAHQLLNSGELLNTVVLPVVAGPKYPLEAGD